MREAEKHSPLPDASSSDPLERRRRKAIWLVVGMLLLSLLVVALGSFATTRTESISITGYSSGVILAFGSFLGVLGLCLEENRKQLLIASIVFLSFGIIVSFFCVVVDGVFILLSLDMRPLRAGRCQYYTSGNGYIYENYFASVPCQGLTDSCSLKVRSGTCYCCDLYDCANGGYLNNHYEFVGVKSCQDVMSLYAMIWLLTALNLSAFVLGILTTAVLGSIKDVKGFAVSPDIRTQLQAFHSSTDCQDSNSALSPTAPLIQDHGRNALYPNTSPYYATSDTADGTQPISSDATRTQINPPPFAPLYNLLHCRTQGFTG
ncbi:transmembrane protein 255B isoform X1 [Lepisosteus oculatus]|uniref:Transmembrane protein 255B-like n=1 Tax=Lepisosteus oculatus TaxID=7918 RepID=W5MN58_LEPOC|nr:PREDICTED: transmembrane protein 255B-like isoform X1 [Lepisosteus oculatus]